MASASGSSNRNGIQVIARAASILRVLRDSQTGMSLGQISERVNLPRSTVQRIVGALQKERLVISDSQGGGLRLGPELNTLAEAAKYNIVDHCRLLLSELTQTTGETTDLSVLRGAGMIFLDQVPGIHRLRTVSSVGEIFPLTTTANGRSCLALMDEDQALSLASNEWGRQGIEGDLQEFMNGLAKVRENGLAFDSEEHTLGISALGFAFRDWVGDIHAISIPVPSTRLNSVLPVAEKSLRKAKVNIEKMIHQNKQT